MRVLLITVLIGWLAGATMSVAVCRVAAIADRVLAEELEQCLRLSGP